MSLQYTYSQLATLLQEWPATNDPEFIANLPNIIAEGEEQLIRDFGLQIFEDEDVCAIVNNSFELQKPDNMISLEEMYYSDPTSTPAGKTQQLTKMHPDFVRAHLVSTSNPTLGSPRYYCESDQLTWTISPAPNFSGTMHLQLVRRPDMLSPGLPTGTSWLSEHYADILMLQCLMVAERWLKNDDRWAVAKRELDVQMPGARAEVAKLRRVTSEDQTTMRDIQRPSNAEGNPEQN